jgi:hypothetical protein
MLKNEQARACGILEGVKTTNAKIMGRVGLLKPFCTK